MNQLPSSEVALPRGGVNPGTAVAILVAVAFSSTVIFIAIAESVFPTPAMADDRGSVEQAPAAPAAQRPGDGAELAAVEAVAPDQEISTEPGEDEAVESATPGAAPAPGRSNHDGRGTRPDHLARPDHEGTAAPVAPARPQPDLFGRDTEDPLGNLDFGPLITG